MSIQDDAECRSWQTCLQHSWHSSKVIRISHPEIHNAVFVCLTACVFVSTSLVPSPTKEACWDLQKSVRGRENEDAKKKHQEDEGREEGKHWEREGKERPASSLCGEILSHRAAGADSGRSADDCWPRWGCNFLSVGVCGLRTCREASWNTAAHPQRGTGQLGNKDDNSANKSHMFHLKRDETTTRSD